MPSTPIAPHLFPRIIIVITSLFTAHLPLPPPHPEWHSGKGDGGINTEQLLPAALSSSHFPCSKHGSSPGSAVLQKIPHAPEWSPWAVGAQLAALWSLCLGPAAPCALLSPQCHRTGSRFFPPSLLLCNVLPFLKSAVCQRAEGLSHALWRVGWSCLELAVSIPGQHPAPSHGQCLGNDILCSNLSETRGGFYVDGRITFLDTGNILLSCFWILGLQRYFQDVFSSYTLYWSPWPGTEGQWGGLWGKGRSVQAHKDKVTA